MKVLLTDKESEERIKRYVGQVEYIVQPDKIPCKYYTIIKNNKTFDINPDTRFEISFILADKYNNTFEGRNDIINNLTLLNNINNTTKIIIPIISFTMNNENIYKIILYPKYPPKKMRLNVLYNDTEYSVDCFMEDIIVNIITTIDYYQTQIVSKNKERIKAGEYLDMKVYTFDKKGECFDDDYSNNYEIRVIGPVNSVNQLTIKYSIEKMSGDTEVECNNEYKIIIEEKHKYKYAGNYIIKVYGGSVLISQYNQLCIPNDYNLFFLDYEFDPNHISVLETNLFIITATDEYLNKKDEPLIDSISIDLSREGVKINEKNILVINMKLM